MTLNKSVYVIIVTYNPKKWVEKCFNSLRNSTLKCKTIVIDNGSTDGSQEIIQKNYPEIDFIQSDENLGFGKANNIGIERAYNQGAEYVFLLNHDAWVENDTLEGLVHFMESNTDFGIVSPVHFSGNMLDYDQGFLHFCSEDKIIASLANRDEFIEVPSINGAFMMLSKKCILVIKGFDPIFQFYGEDVDLCIRAKKKGFRIGVINNYKAFHDRGERKMTNERLFNHFRANHLIQIKATFGRSYLVVFSKSIYSIILLACRSLFKLEINTALLYFKVIPFFIKNYYEIKKSYFEYNS